MKCEEVRRKVFVNELNSEEKALVERHIAGCQECASYFASERSFDMLLEESFVPSAIPPHLRERVLSSLAESHDNLSSRHHRLFPQWRALPASCGHLRSAAVVLSFCAILAGLVIFGSKTHSVSGASSAWVEALVADHIEYLPKPHPEEIVSSSVSEIQEWFIGKLPFLFALPALDNASLLGGRLCFLRGERSALLFYRLKGVPVSLFVLSDEKKPFGDIAPLTQNKEFHWSSMQGVNLLSWVHDGVAYALVSSLDRTTLLQSLSSTSVS